MYAYIYHIASACMYHRWCVYADMRQHIHTFTYIYMYAHIHVRQGYIHMHIYIYV